MDRTDVLLAARTAYADNLARLTPLLELPGALTTPVGGGSVWTVRETAVHVAVCSDLYSELAAGLPSPAESCEREYIAAASEQLMADVAESDPEKVAALVWEAGGRFLSRTEGWPADHSLIWHCGVQMDLASLTSVLAAEVLLHGYDAATAVGAPWPIDPAHALLAIASYAPVLHLVLNPETTKGLTAAYGVSVRGGPAITVRFTDGVFAIEPPGADVDCEITADPVAFLLVLTGRLPRWPAISLGLIGAGGRRPELAVGFPDLFLFP